MHKISVPGTLLASTGDRNQTVRRASLSLRKNADPEFRNANERAGYHSHRQLFLS